MYNFGLIRKMMRFPYFLTNNNYEKARTCQKWKG